MTNLLKTKFKLLCILLMLSTTACQDDGKSRVEIMGQQFVIPKANLLKFQSGDLVHSFSEAFAESANTNSDIALFFKAEEVKSELDSYHIEISGFGSDYRPSLIPIIHLDADKIKGTGWKLNRFLVENGYPKPDSASRAVYQFRPDSKIQGHFRFFYENGESSWLLIDRSPRDEQANVVAICSDVQIKGEVVNFECKRTYRSNKINMDYNLMGENYYIYSKVDAFILGKIESWRNRSI